jgi:hypothetical protein
MSQTTKETKEYWDSYERLMGYKVSEEERIPEKEVKAKYGGHYPYHPISMPGTPVSRWAALRKFLTN